MSAIDCSSRWNLGDRDSHEVTVTLPLKTVSEANMREHWAPKMKRQKQSRTMAAWACGAPLADQRKALAGKHVARVVIRLTRVAPRQLDDDNLRSALKAVRDGVTDALGLHSDADDRLTWVYLQAKGGVREYAVRVAIASERG